jgi:hypothetical protein
VRCAEIDWYDRAAGMSAGFALLPPAHEPSSGYAVVTFSKLVLPEDMQSGFWIYVTVGVLHGPAGNRADILEACNNWNGEIPDCSAFVHPACGDILIQERVRSELAFATPDLLALWARMLPYQADRFRSSLRSAGIAGDAYDWSRACALAAISISNTQQWTWPTETQAPALLRDDPGESSSSRTEAPPASDQRGRAPAAVIPPTAPLPEPREQPPSVAHGRAVGAPLPEAPTRDGPSPRKQRLAVAAALVAAIMLAAILVLFTSTREPNRSARDEVQSLLDRFERASRDKDYRTLCNDLFATSFVRQTASSGLPCQVALRTGLEDVRNPTLDVLSIKVDGDRATARVRGSSGGQPPAEDTYTFIREKGGWRILPPRPSAAP